MKYSIPDTHVLVNLDQKVRTCSPPLKCYSIYEEHLKSGVCFPPHLLVIEDLRFWNFLLVQVYPLFARHLVGFIIICRALSVSTNCDLFRKYHGIQYGKIRWYTCMSKKSLVLSKPSKIKDWKDRLFFVRDPSASLKSSWTTRKRLPGPT